MKVAGKIVFVTLLLIVASLLFGHCIKGSPALFEPKFEQSSPETVEILKAGDKKEIYFSELFDCDDDFVNVPAFYTRESFAFQYYVNNVFRLQKQALERIPRYLLFCSLKLDFC